MQLLPGMSRVVVIACLLFGGCTFDSSGWTAPSGDDDGADVDAGSTDPIPDPTADAGPDDPTLPPPPDAAPPPPPPDDDDGHGGGGPGPGGGGPGPGGGD